MVRQISNGVNQNERPIDSFAKRAIGILQKEYLVIGKTRVSAFTSCTVLAFFLGMTLTIGFLASRTGTFEESEAARVQRQSKPVWSRWSKAQEGNCQGKTSALTKCREVKLRKRIIEQGKKKTITVQGFQTRTCIRNCKFPLPSPFTNTWLLVATHRGTPLPLEAMNFICGDAVISTKEWIIREANKYGAGKPFSNIKCIPNQIFLPEELWQGDTVMVEGQEIIVPLNASGTIQLLEATSQAVKKAKYVTVIHYVPYDIQFANFVYDTKYDFGFIKTPAPSIPFYPPLDVNNYSEEFIHELMHKLGATDKYFSSPQQACLIDPATGEEYSGYDIMCHRIPQWDGFITPPLTELIVTDPTAKEIKWLTQDEIHR